MHLDQIVEAVRTTRQDAAKDLIKMVQEAWELDSIFCANYIVRLSVDNESGYTLRLITPNASHESDGKEVFAFGFADDEEAARIQLTNAGTILRYDELMAADESSEEAAQMWSDAKNSYYNDGDEGWIADEVEQALTEAGL